MGTPAAGHRLDSRGTREQSRTFHLSRILGGIRAAWDLLLAMEPVSPGVYAIPPAIVLRARERVDLARPYLDDDEGRISL